MSVEEHKAKARATLEIAIITISDTRTFETDRGGSLIEKLSLAKGHRIADRRIIRDDVELIRVTVEELLPTEVDAILLTGGTGLGPRDVTFEALALSWNRRFQALVNSFACCLMPRSVLLPCLAERLQVCASKLFSSLFLALRQLFNWPWRNSSLPELPHLVSHVRPSKNA